jgi:hypothetical protein
MIISRFWHFVTLTSNDVRVSPTAAEVRSKVSVFPGPSSSYPAPRIGQPPLAITTAATAHSSPFAQITESLRKDFYFCFSFSQITESLRNVKFSADWGWGWDWPWDWGWGNSGSSQGQGPPPPPPSPGGDWQPAPSPTPPTWNPPPPPPAPSCTWEHSQCGGLSFGGNPTCCDGFACQYINDWW